MAERLQEAQSSLSLLQEVTRHGDRDRKCLGEEMTKLRSSLQTTEANCTTQQVSDMIRTSALFCPSQLL